MTKTANRSAVSKGRMMTRVKMLSLLFTFSAWRVFGQSAPDSPAFEVATVKVSRSAAIGPQKEQFLPGGRLEISNATLKELIVPVYGVKPNMIIGGPKWLDSQRFDIVAKARPEMPVPTLLLMMRTLLKERFKLAFHQEDRSMPAYALVIGKDGPKLRQVELGGRPNCTSRPIGTDRVVMVHRECRSMTMTEFVRQLGLGGYGIEDRPVVDLTGLAGSYDFEFEYSQPRRGGQAEGRRQEDPVGSPDLAGPTIFDAMAQIGLKLEASKQTVPVIVIDGAERPSEN